MKRILSLALSLLVLMSMVTIAGATGDSNIIWEENFEGDFELEYEAGSVWGPPYTVTLSDEIKFYNVAQYRLADDKGSHYHDIYFEEAAYGKGNHEKSLFFKQSHPGDSVNAYMDATFPEDLPIASAAGEVGHIAFDWINFTTAKDDSGYRELYLKVKYEKEGEEPIVENVYIGALTSSNFTYTDNSVAVCAQGSWNRLSAYVTGNTVSISPYVGAAWKSFTFEKAGYTPVAITGLKANIGFHYSRSWERLYGFDNFIAEKAASVPTDARTDGHPAYVPFTNLGLFRNGTGLQDNDYKAIHPSINLNLIKADNSTATTTLPEKTTATLAGSSLLGLSVNGDHKPNHESDHEFIFENAEGYYITDSDIRASVMGDTYFTMDNALSLGFNYGYNSGEKLHMGFKFMYTGEEHGAADHVLMAFKLNVSGNEHNIIRMKSDGTLIDASGNAMTKLAANEYYRADVFVTNNGEASNSTAEVYINGKYMETVSYPMGKAVRFNLIPIYFYGEPKGPAEEVTFGETVTSAVPYYAHSLHIDDVYVSNSRNQWAFNKTANIAYDLNKSLSEAADNIAKYGIVLDPGSMTASRVSEDWTAASFLAAVNLPNVSVVDADGTALIAGETLVGNKIKITGEFGAPVYYDVVAIGANVANTDFVLAAQQDGALVTTTCAAGKALTVSAVDDNYATPQIFVAEYETINGNMKLVSCKGGVGSASLTPSAAGNTVKVFVVNTKDGLQPLYDANLNFTVQ